MDQRRMTRRRFLYWGLAATGGTMLAACSPKPAPAPTAAPAGAATTEATQATAEPATVAPSPAPKEVEIRLAEFDYVVAGGENYSDWLKRVVWAKFQEAHPNVKITFEPYGDGWDTKTLTQMAAGTAPDFLLVWAPILQTWAEKGQLVDIQPLIDRDMPEADKVFIPWCWEQMWHPFLKMRMGIPMGLDITSCYYNKTAFQEDGVPLPTKDWTTDDYVATASKLVKKDASGQVTRWGGHFRPDYWNGYFQYVAAFGGQTRDEETWMKCLLGEPDAQAGLEWMRRAMWDLNAFIQDNQLASGTRDAWTGALPSGLVCFVERSLGDIPTFLQDIKDFEWDIAHIPQGPKGRSCMGLPSAEVIYKGTADRGNLDAAWKLAKFYGGEFFNEEYSAVSGFLPLLPPLLDKWASNLRAKEPRLGKIRLETVIEQVNMGYPKGTPMFRFQSAAQEIIDPAMQQIYTEGTAPVSLLKDITADVEKAQQEALARATG